MFQQVKGKETGELKKVEEQLRNGAILFLEKTGGRIMYGMTGRGTKARAWSIKRAEGGEYLMTPYFGNDCEADWVSYIDANDKWPITSLSSQPKSEERNRRLCLNRFSKPANLKKGALAIGRLCGNNLWMSNPIR